MILKKLNAAALYYALTVSIVISTILLTTILLAYYSRYNIHQDVVKQKLLHNAYSGIQLTATNNNDYGHGKTIDIYGLGNDSVYILSRNWGLYKTTVSRAFHKNSELTKIAITGKVATNNKNISLYLPDKNEPLIITGSTKITGDCFLPKSGIKRGYIEGKHYSGEKLVEGKIYESEIKLPSINDLYITDLKSQFNTMPAERDSTVYLEETDFSENIERSFGNSTILLIPQHIINITSGSRLKGNIIVLSNYAVNVSAGATIEDIIIHAPVINIESNFSGNAQLFATDSIVTGNKCDLYYPTSIVIINSNNRAIENPYIRLGENTTITGNILTEKSISQTKNKAPSLFIDKNVTVSGWVYINGKVQHSGIIHGHLFCEGFILKTASSLYENHLADAEINCEKIPKRFLYPYLIADTYKTEIVKWLY